MENSNKAINQAGGFIVGAAIGALLGVLFAPNKGSETRKQIASSRDNLVSTFKDQYGNLIELVNDEISEVKHKASEAIDYGLAKAEKTKNILTN